MAAASIAIAKTLRQFYFCLLTFTATAFLGHHLVLGYRANI
jgi:hypothetical protein